MAAKRSRKNESSDSSIVAGAAEAMGKAVGTAMTAIESAVGSVRRRGPNGYEKLQKRGEMKATATDRPARSGRGKASTAGKSKTRARSASSRGRSKKSK